MPSPDDCATITAHTQGVDQVAKEIEAKWGVDRLPLLVSDELRAKFIRQAEKWSAALGEAWNSAMLTRDQLDAVVTKSAAMRRAYAALDTAAEEAGHRPIAPWVWEARLADGTVAAIVQTDAEAGKVIAEGRHVTVWTMREVANVIDALGVIKLAKSEFPGAKVQAAQTPVDRSWVKAGDELTF
jgi:hypothetical protein